MGYNQMLRPASMFPLASLRVWAHRSLSSAPWPVFGESRRRLPSRHSVGSLHSHVRVFSNICRKDIELISCMTSLVLFLIYFPAHLKYTDIIPISNDRRAKSPFRDTTSEWKLAVTLATIVAIHM